MTPTPALATMFRNSFMIHLPASGIENPQREPDR
jgi:hypothetical protein